MWIVSSYDFPLTLREVQVGQRADFASLIDMFVSQVFFGTILEPNIRITQNTPSRFITIAPVNRVGKEAFLHMVTYQFEKGFGLDCLKIWRCVSFQCSDQFALLSAIRVGERLAETAFGFGVQRVNPKPIGFQVMRVWATERPVEILDDADCRSTGSASVGREKLFKKGIARRGFRNAQGRQG